MPRVPIHRTAPTFQAASAPDFGALRQNRTAQDIARSLGQVGEGVLRQIQENDETNLLAFSNQLLQGKQQLLNDPDAGFLGSQGLDAQNRRETVGQEWGKQVETAMQGLPERVRAKAQAMASKYTLDFTSDVDTHVRQQNNVYRTQVYRDTLASTTSEAVLNFADAGRVKEQAESAAIATRLERRRQGLPEDDAGRAAASAVYQAAIERQAGTDILGAERRYFELLASGDLTGDSAAALDRVLRPIAQDSAATDAANVILNGGTIESGAGVAGDVDALIVGLESGGNDAATNSTSSATGAGQFLNSTWLQLVKAEKPELASGKSDAELLALRTDGALSRQMVAAYREQNSRELRAAGVTVNAVNVYAAHHFGPDGAVAFAKASNDTPMSSILNADAIAANKYLQGKTKADVLGNWQRRGLDTSAGALSFDGPAATEGEALRRAQMVADPRQREAIMSKIRLEWGIRDVQQAAAKKATSERVYSALANNTDPTASLSQLVSPADYAAMASNGQLPSFENYRRAILEGRLIQDNTVLADVLYRESALAPDAFQKRDLHGLADQLSTSTLTELLNRQATLGKRDEASQKDWMSDDQRVNRGFQMLGLGQETDAAGKDSGRKNAPRDSLRGEFRIAFQNSVTAFMQGHDGRKPTPEESDVLLRTTVQQFSRNLGAGNLSGKKDDKGGFEANKERPVGLYSLAAQYEVQISEQDRQSVRQAYMQKYGTQPTDAWVTQYIAQKQQEKKQ